MSSLHYKENARDKKNGMRRIEKEVYKRYGAATTNDYVTYHI